MSRTTTRRESAPAYSYTGERRMWYYWSEAKPVLSIKELVIGSLEG